MEVKEMIEDADLEISAGSQVNENAGRNLKMSNSEKNISAPDFSLNNSKWLGILNTFRTKYYYNVIELSSQIETLNIQLKTA